MTATEATPRERLLSMRVAGIIDAHPQALGILIDGGFTPLGNKVMRLAMAGTVNLAQAFRIRGLDDSAEESIIARLLEIGVQEQVS